MANLSTQYPQGLEDIMGGFGGQAMSQQVRNANRNNELNQQSSLQDMLFAQQKQPLELERMGLNNQTSREQLPGIQADSWVKQRNNDVRKGLSLDQEQKAQLSKIMAGMSDDQWKETENGIKDMMVNGATPQLRQEGARMYENFPEMVRLRTENKFRAEREEALARIRAEELRATNAAKPAPAGKQPLTVEQRILSAKKASERLALLRHAAKQAELEGDVEKASFYASLAEEQVPQANAELNNQPRPGSPNLGGMGITPNEPVDLSKKPTTTPGLYKSAEDVRAAYRAKKLTKEQAKALLQKNFGFE